MWWAFAPRRGSKELAGTENTNLRFFSVPVRLNDSPQEDIADSQWQECGPKTVGTFSAVAYYFGRDLQKALNVPVGLIHPSHRGSAVAPWTNRGPLRGLRRKNLKPVP